MSKLIDFLKGNSAAGVVGEVIEKASNVADKFIQTKEEKDEFMKLLYEIEIDDVKNARDNETARDVSPNSSWLSKNIHEIILLMLTSSWMLSMYVPALIDSGDIKDVVMLGLGYLFGKSMPNKS